MVNILSKYKCSFCNAKTKIQGNCGEAYFCPNGHHIIDGDEEIVLQPQSTGTNFNSIIVYRYRNEKGPFCDEKGNIIPETIMKKFISKVIKKCDDEDDL